MNDLGVRFRPRSNAKHARGLAHLTLDGAPLDRWLVRHGVPYADQGLATLANDLERGREVLETWDAFLPDDGASTILPISTCPECRSFNCSCVVAEVVRDGDLVHWRRIGAGDPYEHTWCDTPALSFALDAYLTVRDRCLDHARLDPRTPEGHPGFQRDACWRTCAPDRFEVRLDGHRLGQLDLPAGTELVVTRPVPGARPPYAWAELLDRSAALPDPTGAPRLRVFGLPTEATARLAEWARIEVFLAADGWSPRCLPVA